MNDPDSVRRPGTMIDPATRSSKRQIGGMNHVQSPWLVCPAKRRQPRYRVFCFPHAGGGASSYVRWSHQLPQDVELWSIQPPGRENRFNETPLRRVHDTITLLAPELVPLLDLPCVFLGHSLGAHVAYELAQRLLQSNQAGPIHLFASAAPAPHLPNTDPPISDLPDQEFLQEISQKYGGIRRELFDYPELLAIVLVALRADTEMCETYQCQSIHPLPCGITVLGGEHDDIEYSRLAAWQQHTLGPFAVHLFAGGHFYLENHETSIAQLILESLP